MSGTESVLFLYFIFSSYYDVNYRLLVFFFSISNIIFRFDILISILIYSDRVLNIFDIYIYRSTCRMPSSFFDQFDTGLGIEAPF